MLTSIIREIHNLLWTYPRKTLIARVTLLPPFQNPWKWGTSKSMLRLNGWIQEFHMGLSEDFNKKNKKIRKTSIKSCLSLGKDWIMNKSSNLKNNEVLEETTWILKAFKERLRRLRLRKANEIEGVLTFAEERWTYRPWDVLTDISWKSFCTFRVIWVRI